MQEGSCLLQKLICDQTGTTRHWGKDKTELSQCVIGMPLEINYRLRSKTSRMSHTSQNKQTPTAPSAKPHCPRDCVHLRATLIGSPWRQLKKWNGREKIAEGEGTRDNLTGLFLTKYNKTTWDFSNLCYRLWLLSIRWHLEVPKAPPPQPWGSCPALLLGWTREEPESPWPCRNLGVVSWLQPLILSWEEFWVSLLKTNQDAAQELGQQMLAAAWMLSERPLWITLYVRCWRVSIMGKCYRAVRKQNRTPNHFFSLSSLALKLDIDFANIQCAPSRHFQVGPTVYVSTILSESKFQLNFSSCSSPFSFPFLQEKLISLISCIQVVNHSLLLA